MRPALSLRYIVIIGTCPKFARKHHFLALGVLFPVDMLKRWPHVCRVDSALLRAVCLSFFLPSPPSSTLLLARSRCLLLAVPLSLSLFLPFSLNFWFSLSLALSLCLQLLIKGEGIFTNPSSPSAPAKLRLLYEGLRLGINTYIKRAKEISTNAGSLSSRQIVSPWLSVLMWRY